jgi:hypothetical protein
MRIAADQPPPLWVRAVLWLTAAQALLLLLALVHPASVNLLVPWPASPLNARFIASLYVSLGFGVVLCSLGRTFVEMRIVLVGIAFATTLLALLTVLRMVVHPGELSRFPLFWLLFYTLDPLLVGLVFLRFGWGGWASGPRSLAPLWLVQAACFGAGGLVSLFVPDLARSLWPWTATEPQIQLYSAFFLTICLTSLLAAREPRWEGVRWVALMMALLALLVMGVSFLHLERFHPGAATAAWLTFFSLEAITFAGLFIERTVRPPRAASAS